ncbi:MAG: aldehyde dehydrogenase family protein [Gammaproteobacteria bacterium]
MEEILSALNLKPLNFGASSGEEWWSSSTALGTLQSHNPTNEKLLAEIYRPNQADYEKIVSCAQQSFQSWQQVPAPKRGELIRLIANELRIKKDALGTLIALENGKIKQEADGEVQEMIDMADFAVGLSRMIYGNTMPSERPQHRMYEQWHPLGPVGVITSFNFPVAVWSWNAFIAAICGNTVIWKPSSKVPLCALAVQHICNRVMQQCGYSGIFSLFVTDDNALAEKLVADKRLPLISFTGSTAVGRKVGETVARRLGRSLLELSGNNAIIVDETADFKLAIPAIVFGAVGTAGQRCTSTRRVLVHESRYKKLIKALIAAYQKVIIGNPLEKNVMLGPLIDKQAVQHYQAALQEVTKLGGKILYGGEILDRPGYYVQPTLVRAENHWDVVQRETFAPILYIMPYQTLPEAVALQNAVSQGLSSALFTENLLHAEYFLSAAGSDCGIANINIGTSGAEIGGAFGGEKETGGGREAGSTAWQAYMRRQTNTINWGHELPLAQGIQFTLE